MRLFKYCQNKLSKILENNFLKKLLHNQLKIKLLIIFLNYPKMID